MQGRLLRDAPPAEHTAYTIHDNVVAGALYGVGADQVRMTDNTASGMMKAVARQEIEVTGNEAQGITCTASAGGSQVTLTNNRSLHSAGPGLAVIGAEMATITNNTATDSLDSGLVVRRVARIVASDNELSEQPRSAASRCACRPTGDCNENVDVAIDELVTVVGIALQSRPFHDCDAADVNRDRAVTVDEIVLSVGAALGRPDPLASSIELRNNRVEDNQRFGINVFARAALVAAGNRVLRTQRRAAGGTRSGPLSAAQLNRQRAGPGRREGLSVDAVDTARNPRQRRLQQRRCGDPAARGAGGRGHQQPGVRQRRPGHRHQRRRSPAEPPARRLTNNTIFGNSEWGILIGRGATPSTGTLIRDNILQHNVGGGIAAEVGALPDLGHRVQRQCRWLRPRRVSRRRRISPTTRSSSTPAGTDGLLGGEGFADDDFHLQPTSPAIDAGSATAAELGITGSAVAGRSADEGIVDLGYHYGVDDTLIHR